MLQEHADPIRDFVGHVGGDDFLVVHQSDDWDSRCHSAVAAFNDRAKAFFTADENRQGGFWGEDRNGGACFFPLTTLSIGGAVIGAGMDCRHEDIAATAAAAKRHAKAAGRGLHVDR